MPWFASIGAARRVRVQARLHLDGEQIVAVNTAAIGGNASLLTIAAE